MSELAKIETSEVQEVKQSNVVGAEALLQLAVSKDLDIEKLERLMAMKEREDEKNAKTAFFDALAMFQAGCPEIKKTKDGHNNKYAPLSEITKTIAIHLLDNGLSYRWEQKNENNLITITCIVSHRLGHSESTSLSGEMDKSGNKSNIHATASTVSYLQRYTLICALGLSTADEDTDAQGKSLTIDEHQQANITGLIEEVGVNRDRFLKAYKIEKLSDLPDKEYRKAVSQLERKRKQ